MKPTTQAVLIILGIASCQGITQNVETLRAERIEIVDDKGGVKMDVATKIRTLEERVQKLEVALEKQERERAAAPATVTPTPATPPAPSAKPKATKSDVF